MENENPTDRSVASEWLEQLELQMHGRFAASGVI